MVEGILWTGRDVDQRVTAFAYDDAWPVTYSREGGQTLTIQTAGRDIIAFTAWYSVKSLTVTQNLRPPSFVVWSMFSVG